MKQSSLYSSSEKQPLVRPPASPPPNVPLPKRQPARDSGGRPRRSRWKKILIFLILLVLTAGGIFGYRILAAGNKISAAEQSLLGQLRDLFFNSKDTLRGEQEGRINVLLLGIGGDDHSGADLTDTIMVASIRPDTEEVALLSIPRDLWVQVPGERYYTRINGIHAIGESRRRQRGPDSSIPPSAPPWRGSG
jgi:polyisoprenyl-teichoic acid--peptidoglycan teichoic acid transferase